MSKQIETLHYSVDAPAETLRGVRQRLEEEAANYINEQDSSDIYNWDEKIWSAFIDRIFGRMTIDLFAMAVVRREEISEREQKEDGCSDGIKESDIPF